MNINLRSCEQLDDKTKLIDIISNINNLIEKRKKHTTEIDENRDLYIRLFSQILHKEIKYKGLPFIVILTHFPQGNIIKIRINTFFNNDIGSISEYFPCLEFVISHNKEFTVDHINHCIKKIKKIIRFINIKSHEYSKKNNINFSQTHKYFRVVIESSNKYIQFNS